LNKSSFNILNVHVSKFMFELYKSGRPKIDFHGFPVYDHKIIINKLDCNFEFHFQMLENRVSTVELMEIKGLDHFDIVENLRSDNHALTKRIKELIAGNK
jgi:hypothetical protein